MKFEDWKGNYNKVFVTKVFPASWHLYGCAGEWKGNTAGGEYPFPKEAPKAAEGEEVKEAPTQLDTNDRWFNNPQYRLSVTKKT
jgi:calpain